jgi:CNT family concentrative nucleoside transporter
MFLLDYFLEYNRYMNLIGIAVIIGIAILFSQNRAHIKFKLIGVCLALQFLIALAFLKNDLGQAFMGAVVHYVGKMYEFAEEGSAFLFGNLCNTQSPWGFLFCIKVFPIIIFFAAFMALLAHWRVIHYAVMGVNYVLRPLLGTSGAETLCAIANIVLGQTEAPLLIRDYLKDMTKSEMLVVMVAGMGTISGAILVVYSSMGVPAGHMITASVMAVPATIMIAKILLPETGHPKTLTGDAMVSGDKKDNALDAIASGTMAGLNLVLAVAAMLISFIAFIALINYTMKFGAFKFNHLMSWIGTDLRLPDDFSLDMVLSYLFLPFGYLFGFTGADALQASQLIGLKVAVNEMIAYSKMVGLHLSERVMDILTYALCGFSNFSSIGIQLGGIGALVPEKRHWLAELGVYAVLGGMLANLLSAMIAGLLI